MPVIPDLARLVAQSASLREEFESRASTLDDDVAALAAALPTRLFKLRVRTTRRATLHPASAAGAAFGVYALGAFMWASLSPNPLAGMSATFASMLVGMAFVVVGALGAVLSVRVPLPVQGSILVYVREGHLVTVEAGWEEYAHKWERKSCSQLIDEDGVLVGSLLAELRRGVDTYFARIEVIDAAREAAREEVDRARRLAEVQGEIGRE